MADRPGPVLIRLRPGFLRLIRFMKTTRLIQRDLSEDKSYFFPVFRAYYLPDKEAT